MPSIRSGSVLLALVLCGPPARAGVLVLANYTVEPIALTLADSDKRLRAVSLAPFQISPIVVSGAVDATFPAAGGNATLRLEPANAYYFVPDAKAGRRLEGIHLPGDPLPEDARLGDGPAPEVVPFKVPVTLLVDDADPRADALWQGTVKRRFEEAAEVVERHSGIRFAFEGFAAWNSDRSLFDPTALLEDFEKKVAAKPGHLAVGYATRKADPKAEMPYGACRGALASHVLMREWWPRNEPERVEALVHYLGQAAGAVSSPDPESAMRPKIANGLALSPRYKVRFDPLNALAMAIWAEERRKGPRATLNDLAPANRARLNRVYKALAHAMPDDRLAMAYMNELDNALAGGKPAPPRPAGPNDPAAAGRPPEGAQQPRPVEPQPPPAGRTPPQDAARVVVWAVADFARRNGERPAAAAAGNESRLRGDDLAAAYVAAAARAAWAVEEQFRATAFLVGLGLSLDEAGALREDVLTGPFAKAVESDSEHRERQSVLGQPTVRSRRDLCQRFAVACATADIAGRAAAEEAGVGRSLFDLQRPIGFCFAALAADAAAGELAQRVREHPERIGAWRQEVRLPDLVPPTDGLRDGLSAERFEQDFGGSTDPRFEKALAEVRDRAAKVPAYRR